jgi:hypothetical protein
VAAPPTINSFIFTPPSSVVIADDLLEDPDHLFTVHRHASCLRGRSFSCTNPTARVTAIRALREIAPPEVDSQFSDLDEVALRSGKR